MRPFDPSDDDERVGEAIEAYLAPGRAGSAARRSKSSRRVIPTLKDDVRAALEGLELVHGLLGLGSAPGSGSGRGVGVGSSHRIGPPDRRLSRGPRAGSRRHGDGLRGRARGPGPPGGAQGAGHPRRARLVGAAAVLERGPHRGRAAPHAHRAGFRRRPGRRPVLLRHAADRRERAGLGRAPSPPQPAAACRWAAADRPAVAVLASDDRHSGSGTSSINSRLGQLWVRVSSGWLSAAAPAHRPGLGRHWPRVGPFAPVSPATSGSTAASRRLPALGDSTASWSSRQPARLACRHRAAGDDAASSRDHAGVSGSARRDRAGLHAGATTSRRRSIRRADRPIFAGSPRSACRRPMPWRMRTSRG